MGLSVLGQRPPYNRVPFWFIQSPSFQAGIMAMGLGDGTPSTVRGPLALTFSAPSPSPDGNWLLWAEFDTATDINSVKVCSVANTASVTTVASFTYPTGGAPGTFPCWINNDLILYDQWVSTSVHDLRYVGKDGTGDSPVETGITSYGGSLWPTVSAFGDYIAYVVIPDLTTGPGEVYVSDYSASTLVHTCQWRNSMDGRALPTWQRASDVLGFVDMPNPTSGTSQWYTVLPDGTGKTNIYSDASRIYWGLSRNAWLSDDSGMVTLKSLGGDVLSATDSRLAIMDGAGGGPSDVSPSLDTGANNATESIQPYVWNQADGVTYRIYVQQDPGTGTDGVSVLEDGTDYFVDAPYSVANRFYEGFGYTI